MEIVGDGQSDGCPTTVYDVAATIERDFEEARARIGLNVDQTILAGLSRRASIPANVGGDEVPIRPAGPAPGVTLKELYDAYMSDPTRNWSPRTRLSYETTRNLIETLRWLPRNALKLYPPR